MLLNSPDCLTVGSIPAKATKADELLNLCISPISARMMKMEISLVDKILTIGIMIKKQNNIINHMNITIHIMKRGNRLEKVIGHSLKDIQISQQIKERKYI